MSEPVMRDTATPTVSPWGAAVRVLTSPGETFRALAGKPSVLVPYLIHTLVGVVAIALSYSATMEALDQAYAQAAQAGMSADQLAAMQATMKGVGVATLVIGETLGPWITGFVLALIATFFGQFQGGGVSLTSYMGMIGYARMPLALSRLLAAVYIAATGQQLNLSPAAFLPEGTSAALVAALGMLNPLGIWYYVLLAIGFAALFGREPRRGWAMPAALFVVGTVLSAAFAGWGSSMMTLN